MANTETKVDIFMPLYVSDYDRDTADLSFEEHGFYLAILRAMWTRGGCLKHASSTASSSDQAGDKQKLARILRTDVETFERIWPSVEKFFVLRADGVFFQKRLSHELIKAKKNKEFAVERARKGGNGKAAKSASSSALSTSQAGAQAPSQALLEVCSSPSGSDLPLLPIGSPDQSARSNEEANQDGLPNGPVTGFGLQRAFARIRAREVPEKMDWQTPPLRDGKAADMADLINADPPGRADVIPTLELFIRTARDGKRGPQSVLMIEKPAFGFAAWCTDWTALREELRAIARRAARPKSQPLPTYTFTPRPKFVPPVSQPEKADGPVAG